MSHQLTRKYRIDVIKKTIEAAMRAGKIVDEKKLISECCLSFGNGNRYVKEYLRDLENTGFLIRKDGKIWTALALEAEEIIKRNDETPTNSDKEMQNL